MWQLIGFDRALPQTNTTHSGPRGTPGYYPEKSLQFDGDTAWDLHSLVAIIVECDMGPNDYMKVKDKRAGKEAIRKHIKT